MTTLRHFTRIADLGPAGVAAVLERAERWKRRAPGAVLADRVLGMVFLNPSLRTRTSFEAAMLRSGGHAIVLDVGAGGVWKLEDRDGVVMDGDRAEHVREAVPVLSRYVDALAVRTFAGLADMDEDERDPVMNAFRAHATVPLVNMESAREHPCQGLADVLTLRERFGTEGLRVTLTWAPHVKPLPTAVPHSFLLSAVAAGCHVTLAHPPGFALHPAVMAEAEAYAAETGGSVRFTGDQRAAVAGSFAVYAKSWAPIATTTDPTRAAGMVRAHADWMVTPDLMDAAEEQAVFLHCLPVRRNVVVADGVLDGPRSAVVDQAENRFHVQRAVLAELLGADG